VHAEGVLNLFIRFVMMRVGVGSGHTADGPDHGQPHHQTFRYNDLYRQDGGFGLIDVLSCKAWLNNIIKKGCVHHFIAEGRVSTSFLEKKKL
jgi:hypothetical protein